VIGSTPTTISKSQQTMQYVGGLASIPGEADSTDGKPTTEHVDNFHREIETTG